MSNIILLIVSQSESFERIGWDLSFLFALVKLLFCWRWSRCSSHGFKRHL